MQLIHFNNALALFAITCSAGPIAQFTHKIRDLEQNRQSPGPTAYPSPLPLDIHVPAASDEANGGLDVVPITPSVTADGTQTAVPQASYTSTEVPGSSILPAEGYLGTVAPLLSPEATLASSTADSSRATVDSGSSSSTEIPALSMLPAEGYLGTVTPLVSTEVPLPSSTADSGTSSSTEIPASSPPAGGKHSSAIASSSAEATLPSAETSVAVIPTTSYSHSASHSASTPSVYNSTTSTSIPLIKHRPTAGPSPELSTFTPISIVIVSPSSALASTPTTTPSLTVGVVGPLSDVGTASSSPSTTFFATALPETPSSTSTVTETATSSPTASVVGPQPETDTTTSSSSSTASASSLPDATPTEPAGQLRTTSSAQSTPTTTQSASTAESSSTRPSLNSATPAPFIGEITSSQPQSASHTASTHSDITPILTPVIVLITPGAEPTPTATTTTTTTHPDPYAKANANGDPTRSPASGPTEGAEITTIHATATVTKSVVVFASGTPTAETPAPVANTEESEPGLGSKTALTTATVTAVPSDPYRDPGDAHLSIVPVTPGVMTVTTTTTKTETETETETVTKTERETVTQTVTETMTEKETVILRGS
ncbi:hypothetical protein GB937_000532 [Aspergillus fischeri]|nr:hypothetical protein GB937_000532 [Aspergillus fischeri]